MAEPVVLLRDFIRANTTDPNTVRSGAGTNWIYDDFPREDLASSSYPRVSIIETNESSIPLGFRSNNLWTTMDFQIDILVKDDTYYTIDSTFYADINLCRKIARDIEEAFRENWIDLVDAGTVLTYSMTGRTPPAYNQDKRIWKISLDYEFETNINSSYI